MDDKLQLIISEIEKQNITVSEEQASLLLTYYQLLFEKNKVMNLTRITDFRDCVEKHFVDSLMIAKYMEVSRVQTVLDLGSGAGFPGIPLKIVFPHLQVIMIDSVGKKMQFVNDVIDELKLSGAKAVHARAEDLARDKAYREKFDLCVSRAVANLSTLSEYCLPFVKVGGIFAAYKSDGKKEIAAAGNAVRKLGGGLPQINEFTLYDMKRTMVLIQKDKETPGKYPRKAGTPSKEPLC